MVTNVTSLTGNGLKDWLVQRVTAVYFALFAAFLLGFIVSHPQMDYVTWSGLFHCVEVRIASVLALLAFTFHAWVGLWTVTTDYLKCTALRLSIQMFILLGLLSQLFWGLMMIWGQ